MKLLDTSVILSFYGKDKHFPKAEKIFKKILEGEKAAISSLTLCEICGVLARKFSQDEAREVRGEIKTLTKIGSLKLYPISREIVELACELAIKVKMKGSDAIIAATAIKLRCGLETFDEELKQKFEGLKK